MKPVIALTIGDYNGVGPEIVLKAARHPSVTRICTPLLVGPLAVFEAQAKRLKFPFRFVRTNFTVFPARTLSVLDVGDGIAADVAYGKPTKVSGRSAGIAIEKAVDLCLQNKAAAMVTAPVSKEGLSLAGYSFPGQTEMVAMLSRSQRVVMLLVGPKLRVGLVTIHSSLRSVPDQLSMDKIVDKAALLHEALRRDFRIPSPRLAVLGLNPHAGENGLFGNEESTMITPALEILRQRGVTADGPFPADAFFGMHAYRNYDAVLAMYHDQGLIPLKMAGFERGVNYSAGLDIVRTSPDHGTAYDIAGRNIAKADSMREAIALAVRIAQTRGKK